MATYEQRNKIINDIYQKVIQNQFNGICIDFAEIDDVNSFNRFLIEITPKFKESGLTVFVKKNKFIDTKKIKSIADFVI